MWLIPPLFVSLPTFIIFLLHLIVSLSLQFFLLSIRQAQYWDDKRLSENILMHDRTYQLPWVLFVSCVTMLSQLCQQLFNGKKKTDTNFCAAVCRNY